MDRRLVPTNYGNTSYRSRPLPFTLPTKSFVTEVENSSAACQKEPMALGAYVRGEDKCTLFEPGPSCLSALCVCVCVCVYTSRDAGVTPT
jgi:hypothetical protein